MGSRVGGVKVSGLVVALISSTRIGGSGLLRLTGWFGSVLMSEILGFVHLFLLSGLPGAGNLASAVFKVFGVLCVIGPCLYCYNWVRGDCRNTSAMSFLSLLNRSATLVFCPGGVVR